MDDSSQSAKGVCCYCGTSRDLRPYGPGGAPLCFGCMKATPEREAEAKRQFGGMLDREGVVVVGVPQHGIEGGES